MQKYITVFVFVLAAFAAGHSETINEDFEEGMPQSFVFVDNDGNEPSADALPLGFEKGKGWIPLYLSDEKNRVACSTSWYSPAGTSDDWMILPPVKVDNERVCLKWRSKASDSYMADGYSVYVSTEGESVSDFNKSEPLFTTKAESGEWISHEISLDRYKGKEIRIAFVNNSTDCAFLYVDDIYVGSPRRIYARPAMKTIARAGERIALKAYVGTELASAVTNYIVRLKAGDTEYEADCTGKTVVPGEEREIDFGAEIELADNELLHCVLETESEGEVSEYEFDLGSFELTRVAEEFTGTWCEFCVRGIANIERLREKHPDSFIAIAMHCGGKDRDPMDTHNCVSGLPAWGFEGYPYCIMNRRKEYNGDPENLEKWYDSLASEEVKAGLSAKAYKSGDWICISTDVWFANDEDQANYNLVYTVIENDVHKPGDRLYSQHNAYAGGSRGEMGGFEQLPSVIDSDQMWHQCVARWSFDSAKGVEGLIPSNLRAGVPVSADYCFDMPENVLELENTECCVLLINSLNNQIINATKVSLGELHQKESVDNKVTECEEVARYSLEGIKVTPDYKGIVIVRMNDGTVRKKIER